MADALCLPCKNRGREVKAHRLVGTVPMCDDCYRGKPQPPPAPRATIIETDLRPEAAPGGSMETTDGRRGKIDWAAAQRDRDAGLRVAEIAKKYGVSDVSVYTRTKASKAQLASVRRVAGAPRVNRKKFLRKEAGTVARGDFAAQIRVVSIEEFPGGLRGQNDAEYQALFLKLRRECKNGQGVASRIPEAAKKSKNIGGAVRSALHRLAKAQGLRWQLLCRIEEGIVYVGRKPEKSGV